MMDTTILDQFFAERTYSPNTIKTYRTFLLLFFDWLDGADLSFDEVTAVQFKDWLGNHTWSNATQYLAYNAIRAFTRWRYGEQHPLMRAKVRRGKPEPQRTLSSAQAKRLANSMDSKSPKGIRDLAMLTLLLDTGLRASEIAQLKLKHLHLDERKVDVQVKGGRWDLGLFSITTRKYLEEWIRVREQIARPGIHTVFVSIGGNRPGTSLTGDGLRSIFKRWGDKSGIGLISPHDTRRTFTTVALQNGAPTRVVQRAGRWSNIQMVERYSPDISAADFEPYFPVTKIFGDDDDNDDDDGDKNDDNNDDNNDNNNGNGNDNDDNNDNDNDDNNGNDN